MALSVSYTFRRGGGRWSANGALLGQSGLLERLDDDFLGPSASSIDGMRSIESRLKPRLLSRGMVIQMNVSGSV